MDAALEQLARRRANGRCEYCRLPQVASGVPFEIDHIIARKHKGRSTASNLALKCIFTAMAIKDHVSPGETR